MKNIPTLLLAVTTIALGAVCAAQWHRLAALQTQLTSLQTELDQKRRQTDELQATQKRSDQQRRQLLHQADDLAAQLQARPPAHTNPPTPAPPQALPAAENEKSDTPLGGFGKFMSKIMADPDTKKFIRDQQRMMLDPLYGPLIKQLGLTPEEADRFKELLADNMMKGAENASSLFGGPSSTNRAEALKTLAAEQTNFEATVKAFLGDGRYAQYQDYQQTVGDRALLNQFRQQTTGTDNPLTDQQADQLLAIMREERQAAATLTGQTLPGAGQDQANLQALLSGEQSDKMLQAQETAGQRVYDRARAVLSPDQLNAFGRFQTNQMQMMRLGMQMARQFFTPDKSEPNPPPGGQAPPSP